MPDWLSTFAALTKGTKLQQLRKFGTLSFYAEYANGIDANFSSGSPTGTFTSSRGASNPATFVDANGIVQTTTASNVARICGGFYDNNGFTACPGVIIESAATNLLTQSSAFENAAWTKTNITVTTNTTLVNSPDGTTNADILLASANSGTMVIASATTGQTFSIFLRRRSGSSGVQITANGTNYTTVSLLSNTWARFTLTVAQSNQLCGIRIGSGGDQVYAWGAQYEDQAFASSYIPTAGSALTRNLETLSYLGSSNITNVQTTLLKILPFHQGAEPSVNAYAYVVDTKLRAFVFDESTGASVCFSNVTDTPGCVTIDGSMTRNTTSVFGATFNTSSPYVSIFLNGLQNGTPDTTNNPVAISGFTNFFIGSNVDTTGQFNGIIEGVAIYSNVLSATNISAVSSFL